mgnify:CR=1 FL=1
MKMNRTNTAGRILALLLTALLVLSLAACGTKGGDKMDGMSSEPKNAEEAVAMHKELMAQENAILSEDTALWEKVFMAADKGMTMQEDGKNYGDFLLKTIEDAKTEVARAKERVDAAATTQNEFKVARGKLEVQVEAAIKAITADGTTVLEEALMLPAPTDRDAAERELNQLVRQINNLGPVNQVAMEEYEQLKRRADYIEEQLADLESARKALTKITVAIDRKMRKAFLVTFEKVDANFREIFAMLFPGGQAHLEMTDPEHPAETGIEVVAQPRGKRITKMMLMSGGEKSLTALALLFAVYRTRTVPFYVLDEVEAALDDANLSKLIGALDVLRSDTQLLVISHQRRTMEDADVLYGVSMQADGVSRVVSQKLDRETGKVVNA